MRKPKKHYLRILITLCLGVLGLASLTHFLLNHPSVIQNFQHKIYHKHSPGLVEYRVPGNEVSTLTSYRLADVLQGQGGVTRQDMLLLINRDHPLPADYQPQLATQEASDITLHPAAMTKFADLAAEVKQRFGETLYVTEAYRDTATQDALYREDAEQYEPPGCSEYETGLALDLLVAGYSGQSFINSPVGLWVNENCWRYGFVIRYPYGHEDLTGFSFQPWHIRYVGLPHAAILKHAGLVLESYIDRLAVNHIYVFEDYFVQRINGETFRLPPQAQNLFISSDNCGGYILWGKIKLPSAEGSSITKDAVATIPEK